MSYPSSWLDWLPQKKCWKTNQSIKMSWVGISSHLLYVGWCPQSHSISEACQSMNWGPFDNIHLHSFHFHSTKFTFRQFDRIGDERQQWQYQDVQAKENLWKRNPWLKFWQKKFLDGLNPGHIETSLSFPQEVSFRRHNLPLNFHLRGTTLKAQTQRMY